MWDWACVNEWQRGREREGVRKEKVGKSENDEWECIIVGRDKKAYKTQSYKWSNDIW